LFSQWQGKANGFTKGRDRSFHFGTQEFNIIGMISHLGPQFGVADGIALGDLLKKNGCTNIKVLILVAAPEGLKSLAEKHPDVEVYTASIDSHLNERGYIIPGLGDAGDKIFGTK